MIDKHEELSIQIGLSTINLDLSKIKGSRDFEDGVYNGGEEEDIIH